MKTAEEFKIQAEKLGIKTWPTRECSICGYQMEYIFDGGEVLYDSGCDCTMSQNIQPRTWHDISYQYNCQTNHEVIEKFNKFWGF